MLREFKAFLMRGNVVDLAVAVVLGVAFGAIVTSFVNDLLMPPLGLALGRVNFSDLFVSLSGRSYPTLAAAKADGAPTLNYGVFINAIINLNWFSYVPVWWLTYLATGVLIASLGLLLGYALLTKFIFNHSAMAAQRGEQIRAIIVPYQIMLGYAAIVLGLWTIVATFLYRIA